MLTNINQLKEILGAEYGDGYLALVLQNYGGNAETATHHLLDGDLPQKLLTADKKLSLTAALMTVGKSNFFWFGTHLTGKPTATPNQKPSNILDSRQNVFTGAFDLNSSQPLPSMFSKSKHKKADMSILDDKELVHKHREL